MNVRSRPARVRGAPLIVLAALLSGWIGLRAVWWEYPFPVEGNALAMSPDAPPPSAVPLPPNAAATDVLAAASEVGGLAFHQPVPPHGANLTGAAQLLRIAGMLEPQPPREATAPGLAPAPLAADSIPPSSAPFLPPPLPAPSLPAARRWSLDAWAFWRQGSDAAPVSQGRVPIYGASQAGAVLQYRLAPGSARDPRLYARAYRALISQGESELALGASLRPVPQVPLRAAGEVRYTDTAFGNAVRPAAYVVSELPPVRLPYGAQLEAYGQAGWVGGPGSTGFADGQASVTRELPRVTRLSDNALRLSIGAAAWGGAQRDAQRLDVGPTMRLDLRIGPVPARLSVDWRERVAGDAGPDSGVTATLSTGF